jgi:DUF971 family protein
MEILLRVFGYTVSMAEHANTPINLDLKKDESLTIGWSDGTTSVYPIAYLRKMSPSAEMRELRKEMNTNPLTILPDGMGSSDAITATGAEMVGNYAIKIMFSDGHDTGLYTWSYLREVDPANQADGLTKSDQGPSHNNPLGLPGRG